jgi:hypothetical protein
MQAESKALWRCIDGTVAKAEDKTINDIALRQNVANFVKMFETDGTINPKVI